MSARVWDIPGERPGTLEEIFDSEDSRRQNLVLYEIRKVDGFRKCWEAIGAPGDGYHLIFAVMICIAVHLRPEYRVADHRRELRVAARSFEKTAMALEELATVTNRAGRPLGPWPWLARPTMALEELRMATNRVGRVGFLMGLSNAGLSDPTDPRSIAHLRNIAASLDRLLLGERSRMWADAPE